MQFINEELVDREIEIASYLLQSLSLKQIGGKTGLSKKHIVAHIRNMQEKLGPDNTIFLKKIFRIQLNKF
ncbi:hypothetical protein BH10BAC3_BH10BAC3_04490 [soil metagenome]